MGRNEENVLGFPLSNGLDGVLFTQLICESLRNQQLCFVLAKLGILPEHSSGAIE